MAFLYHFKIDVASVQPHNGHQPAVFVNVDDVELNLASLDFALQGLPCIRRILLRPDSRHFSSIDPVKSDFQLRLLRSDHLDRIAVRDLGDGAGDCANGCMTNIGI